MSTADELNARVDAVIASGPFASEWNSLASYEVPRWYQDAKFGIFIHWGPYSVPAFGNEWYPRNMYLQGSKEFEHHLRTYGPHREFGYKDFVPRFTADRFDADAWVALFRQAGAQFVVPVAEHHDGFAMYDTDRSRWKAPAMGPKRDVVGELAAAARRQWMVFGVSSHRAEHWWFMNGGTRFDSDVRDPAYADFYGPAQREESQPHEQFLEDWLHRTLELVDKYQPQLVWFDWWIEQPAFEPYLRRFAAYYYNRAAAWRRGVVVNHKWSAFPPGTAVYDIERGGLADVRPDVWQNDTSVSRTAWCWVEGHEHKSVDELIVELVDVVAKNGCLLLNVGPRADGTIAEEERALLAGVGAWLTVNGEAIYGTRPWRLAGEGPNGTVEGSFTDRQARAFSHEDVRFTTRTDVTGTSLYAVVLAAPPDRTVRIRALGSGSGLLPAAIATVELLGSDEPVDWTRQVDELRVRLPPVDHVHGALTLKLRLAPDPVRARGDGLHG